MYRFMLIVIAAAILCSCDASKARSNIPELRLTDGDKNFVALSVLGYEFPENTSDRYDSNWLVISGHVSVEGKTWRFTHPCLLTFELAKLAAWFDSLAEDAEHQAEIGFIEPNLSFAEVERGVVRIFFELESRPPWKAAGAYEEALFIDFVMTPEQLKAAGAQIRALLTAFPERGRH